MSQGTASGTRLYRSRTDRVWKGVCGGLARALNLDPVIVRLVAVAVAWATNVWPVLIAYVVAAKILPVKTDAEFDEATADDWDGDRAAPATATVIGWGAIVLGGALLLHRLSGWLDGGLVLALAAVAVGINLVMRGRSREDAG